MIRSLLYKLEALEESNSIKYHLRSNGFDVNNTYYYIGGNILGRDDNLYGIIIYNSGGGNKHYRIQDILSSSLFDSLNVFFHDGIVSKLKLMPIQSWTQIDDETSITNNIERVLIIDQNGHSRLITIR